MIVAGTECAFSHTHAIDAKHLISHSVKVCTHADRVSRSPDKRQDGIVGKNVLHAIVGRIRVKVFRAADFSGGFTDPTAALAAKY